MNAYILHCPHLDRDVRPIINRVPDVQILTGQRTMPGEVGCLRAHQRAVEIAEERHLPYITVFEDDCAFYDEFNWHEWEQIAQLAHASGYGGVHGGSVLVHGARLAKQVTTSSGQFLYALIAADKACSAHCMIYTEHGYRAVLRATQPFDLSFAEQGGKPLVRWPFVAYQRKGASGIGAPTGADPLNSKTYAGGQFVDYEGLFERQNRSLGETLGLQQKKKETSV